MHDLLNAVVYATRPWNSVHGKKLDRRQKITDQRDIDDCLACVKPECTDCKRYAKNRYGYVRPQKA